MPKKSVLKEIVSKYAIDNCPIFLKDQLLEMHPELQTDSVRTTLSRFCNEGSVYTPWRGVYIYSPEAYFDSTEIHLREYLDFVLKQAKTHYYVTLLDAIHELIPTFSKEDTSKYHVMVDDDGIVGSIGKAVPKPHFLRNKKHPEPYVVRNKVKYGFLNLPTAELLAVDLVAYTHVIGGLQESVEAMKALIPKLDFKRLNIDIFEFRTAANIQRLGYIIENVLGMAEMAQPLHDLLDVRYNKVYARNLLASALPATHTNINKRWQLDINVELKNNRI